MASELGQLAVGLLVSLVLGGLLYGGLRIGMRPPAFLLLAVAPVAFVYLWNPPARVYSNHGFMHASIVYQILLGNLPPDNPLLFGEPLLYPWGYHLLAAGLTYGLRTSPFTAFALLNLLSLVLTVVLVFKIARMIFGDRTSGVLAAALSVFGMTVLCQGPLAKMVQGLLGPVRVLVRGMPVAAKFTNVNPNPLGILLFVLFLYAVLGIFTRQRRRTGCFITLALSVCGTGLLYPFLLPALLATCASACLVILVRDGRVAVPRVGSVCACVACGVVVVLPYLWAVSSGRSEAGQMHLALEPGRVLTRGCGLLLVASVMIALLLVKHRSLRVLSPERSNAVLVLLATAATTGLMYILCSAPLGTEYKFLMLSCLSLGILGGPCLRDLWQTRRVASVLLHACLLLPLSSLLISAATADWRLSDPYRQEGAYLRHADPEQDALYSWISRSTDRDAVFVDSQLTIPIFSPRQLYVGLDLRQRGYGPTQPRDGWGMSPRLLLIQSHGYPAEMIDTRMRVAAALCSGRVSRISSAVFSELARTTAGAEVYVVARNPIADGVLAKDRRFRKEFDGGSVSVYRVLKD